MGALVPHVQYFGEPPLWTSLGSRVLVEPWDFIFECLGCRMVSASWRIVWAPVDFICLTSQGFILETAVGNACISQ